MKIRTRILLAFLLVMAGGFYLLVDWVLGDLRPRYLEATEESLVDTANLLASVAAQAYHEGSFDIPAIRATLDPTFSREFHARVYELDKTRVDLRVYLTDAGGIVLYDSDGGAAEGENYRRWNDVYRTLKGTYGARSTRTVQDDPTTSILHVAAPVLVDGKIQGSLTVCKPTRSANLFIQSAKRKILYASASAVLVVLLLGLITAAWVTRPLECLTRYAADVRDGKQPVLPEFGTSEIGSLARSMDEMRDALEGKEYVENYVQTLTHELKGPLSAIQGAVELLHEDMEPDRRDRFLDNLLAETRRIQNLVDRLLLLSSLEGRNALRDREPVELTGLIRDLRESLTPVLEAREIGWVLDAETPQTVEGERFLLRQGLANLLQNAIDFSPDGGTIRVAVTGTAEAVEIEITDQGPGIPDYAVTKIVDRFYSLPRPGTGKKSSGLGLSFVNEVAGLHGGVLEVRNQRDTGAVARLRVARCPD